MSRFISDILQAREPNFSQQIIELERISGKPGVDLRLVSELIQRRKAILDKLDLDQSDTTSAELYHALSQRALADSRLLAQQIGVKASDKPEVVVEKSIKYVRKTLGNSRVWTLKFSVAKKQLKDNPPKKLMKDFSLRSIDSALKREPLSLLFTFARKIESKKWQDKYIAQSTKLSSTDFDYQNIEISQVSSLRQSQLAKAGVNLGQLVYVSHDVAGIIVITPKQRFDGDVLFLVHSILENIKLLKSASLYLKLHGLQTKFPSIIEAIRTRGFNNVSDNYKKFGWRAYSQNLSSWNAQDSDNFDFVFQDDLPVDITDLLSGDSVWNHNFLVAIDDKSIVSSHPSDVILNAVNRRELEEAHYAYGQKALADELFGRYIKLPKVQAFVDSETDNNG